MARGSKHDRQICLNSPDPLWVLSSLLLSGNGCNSQEVKWQVREGSRSTLSGFEVENDWSFTSTPLYAVMAFIRIILPLPVSMECLCFLYEELRLLHIPYFCISYSFAPSNDLKIFKQAACTVLFIMSSSSHHFLTSRLMFELFSPLFLLSYRAFW